MCRDVPDLKEEVDKNYKTRIVLLVLGNLLFYIPRIVGDAQVRTTVRHKATRS